MKSEELRQHMLISYSLAPMKQKDKVKFLRELQGYREKKGKKLYEHSGLIQQHAAQKIGSNAVLVSVENFSHFHNLFSDYNVKFEVKEAWLK